MESTAHHTVTSFEVGNDILHLLQYSNRRYVLLHNIMSNDDCAGLPQ